MYARHDLNTKGWLVIYRSVPEDVTNHLRVISRDIEHVWLHETSEDEQIDEHRVRAPVPESTALALTVDLQAIWQTFFAESAPGEWEMSKTLAGAAGSPVQREFVPAVGEQSFDVCSIPASLFIATQDNTFFFAYGWNHHVAVQSKRQLICLNRGDLVLFRGDCIFSRAASSVNNLCIHAFLDTPRYARLAHHVAHVVPVMNDRRFVDDLFCFVSNCPFKGTGDNSLRRHLNRFHHLFFRNVRTAAP